MEKGLIYNNKYSKAELYEMNRRFDENARLRRKEKKKYLIKNRYPEYSIPKYVMIECVIKNIKTYGELTCEYCKKHINSKRVHFDHIVPRTKGGKGTIDNVNVSCIACNHFKKDKSLSIFLEQLKIRLEKFGGTHV